MTYTRDELGRKLLYDLSTGDLKDAFALVSQGARLDIADGSGATPLSLAASGGHIEMVQNLIERGVAVNQPDKEGYTPLMWAAYAGSADSVKKLLAADADVEARNIAGETAADLAKSQGNLLIASAIMDIQIAHKQEAQAAWNDVPVNTGHDIAVTKPIQLKFGP